MGEVCEDVIMTRNFDMKQFKKRNLLLLGISIFINYLFWFDSLVLETQPSLILSMTELN